MKNRTNQEAQMNQERREMEIVMENGAKLTVVVLHSGKVVLCCDSEHAVTVRPEGRDLVVRVEEED